MRQRVTVCERWGFAENGGLGLGVSALFAGPGGTGKTMAAEVIANELALDLYRIDLVARWSASTSARPRRTCAASSTPPRRAAPCCCSTRPTALFGKRSEVKDSHDRYANIEVSYLLQRMEAYRGLAILTTNMKSALDPAFLRRLRFVVQFPFPDPPSALRIWSRRLPAATPTEGLDFARLAQPEASPAATSATSP